MPWRAVALLFAAALGWTIPTRARADPHTYALVLGANRGGQGQAPLRFAAEDAKRFARVLVELGRTRPDDLELLIEPTPADIEQALAKLRAQLAVHAGAGESSKLLFYYSGHARSRALSLGGSELPLDALREQLLALPSTFTVAVLDACQSGAFSGIKGAVPAADFAASSISDLNNEGVAVMASSTARELSQESPELGGSYFTHHLVTGMRGAADQDRDGSVSLDEAYAYAYQNTLSDTLRTRVGSQHATLETALKGHGRVPLTYTVDADALLCLPDTVEGRIVVQQRGRGAVLAELSKSRASAVSLALPHGAYEVLVRPGVALLPQACAITLARGAVHQLDTRGCPVVAEPQRLAAKGDAPRTAAFERWFVELGPTRRFVHSDGYTDTLADFRFRDSGDFVVANDAGSFSPQIAGGAGLSPYLSLLGRVDRLQKRAFDRDLAGAGGRDARFRWQTWSVALGARLRLPLLRERIVPFVEADVGLGIARSVYRPEVEGEYRETHFGPVLRGDLGATLHLFWRIGLVLSGGYDYAPVLKNDVGQTRDDGGFHVGLGVRLRGLRRGGPHED